MADDHDWTDWTDLKTQDHWFKLRRELESQIRSAIADIQHEYEVNVKLTTATIVTEGDRTVLRVPVAAGWRDDLEQAIAYVIVRSAEEDEPRMQAIAAGVADLLRRWIQEPVPVLASPEFVYPDPEVRWPDMPQSSDATAETVKQETKRAAAAH